MNRFGYYLKLWLMMSKNSFMIVLSNKLLFAIFLIGKIFRFGFFTAFLYFVLKGTKSLGGYNINQVIFFFFTFNLVDVSAQFLFREVYRFRSLVVSGDLDLILTKPFSVLFRVLLGGADVIDFVTIPPLLAAVIYLGSNLNPQAYQVIFYILMLFNSLIISAAFHIAVLALGVITLEIDHTIMVYRDLVNLGKLPVDIYKQPLSLVLTYLVPVGVMITYPAKVLMGLLSIKAVIISLILGVCAIFVAMRFWKFALTKYSSASS